MGYTFILIQDPNMPDHHVVAFIDKWNEAHDEQNQIALIKDPGLGALPNADGWLFNVSLDNSWFEWVHAHLRMTPDLSVCFFIEPKELSLFSHVTQLDDDFPFANIGTILKPTQYGNVKRFLDTALKKARLVTFDDDLLNDFEFDIEDE